MIEAISGDQLSQSTSRKLGSRLRFWTSRRVWPKSPSSGSTTSWTRALSDGVRRSES